MFIPFINCVSFLFPPFLIHIILPSGYEFEELLYIKVTLSLWTSLEIGT